MIAIAQDRDRVKLVKVFSCEPQNQQRLIDSWIRATEERLGKLAGIISAALHRSKDGTRVVNYAQWRSVENRENLFRIGSECWFREKGKVCRARGLSLRSLLPLGQDRAGAGEVSRG